MELKARAGTFFIIATNLMMGTTGKGGKSAIKKNKAFNSTMMAQFLPVVVNKTNIYKQRKICLLLQCHTISHKSSKKQKKHRMIFCDVPILSFCNFCRGRVSFLLPYIICMIYIVAILSLVLVQETK